MTYVKIRHGEGAVPIIHMKKAGNIVERAVR